MPANGRVMALLAGELGLVRSRTVLDHGRVLQSCRPLLELLERSHPAWAKTPWGHTLPRSCVGADETTYLDSVAARPAAACAAVERTFATPLAHWLEEQFELPLLPLRLGNGRPLPSWALRVMAEGQGIHPHCEQVWNPLNLVEAGRLTPVQFEPAFRLSYLYVLEAPAQGGELELFDRQGPASPGSPLTLRRSGLVRPVPGELLLFNAGLHWHQVRPSHGPGRRVVLGGFVRLNRDHTALQAYV